MARTRLPLSSLSEIDCPKHYLGGFFDMPATHIPITFTPRWREELVATSAQGTLIFELTMGKMHVYFPGKDRWDAVAPAWAKELWEVYKTACEDWCRSNNIPISIVHNALVYEEKK